MQREIIYASASEIVRRIQSKECAVTDVVTAFLGQIEQYNPDINAIFDLRTREDLLTEAQEKDQALREGQPGPLHGLPMTIKDNFWVKGLKVSNGHPLYRNFVANEDAELVKKLKAAGAIIMGKTNVPLFSIDWQATNFWNGQTNNPYDYQRVPGGSSGGSAAAVAAGFSPVELGGDQGGSIRVPAHFCGICGIRPTEHALSNQGHIRFPGKPQGHRQITVAGPLAKNVDDLLLMMKVLWNNSTNPLAEIPPVPFQNNSWDGEKLLNIAVAESLNDALLDQEYLNLFQLFVEKVKEKGHRVAYDYPVYDEDEAYYTCGKITGHEFAINMPQLPFASSFLYWFIRLKYRDATWSRGISKGIRASAKEYAETLNYKDAVSNIYHQFFHQYDVWITPVAALEAFPHQRAGIPFTINGNKVSYTDAIASYTFTTALSGHPIVVIPIGRKKNGMPVGVQLHAKKWSDYRLLQIAQSFSKVTDGFVPPLKTFIE
ncbi:amidase [Tunicatimonas pelagia]|uniref:amidase n=1 Tax=Tunicatimonas pelagia TaxID=931531 RepID=UPI00266600AC|nr:amidase [Tunicatimonas pelagia]WKN41346.1 amidase [Tunicatimonas pelagia]